VPRLDLGGSDRAAGRVPAIAFVAKRSSALGAVGQSYVAQAMARLDDRQKTEAVVNVIGRWRVLLSDTGSAVGDGTAAALVLARSRVPG
jgi:hypothetical protein